MNNIELNRELRELKNEKILQEKTIKAEQLKMAEWLKGDMGKEIHDVLSGRKYVQFSKWEKLKYKVGFWFNKLLRIL